MKVPKSLQAQAKKIRKPLLILSLFVVLAISSTTAYFTSFSESEENIFTSGNLNIEVTQDSVLSVQDWAPGSQELLEFSIVNIGSMAEHVKGYLGGTWSNETLDPSVFEIKQLERKVSDVWVVVDSDGLTLSEEFYLSADGTEATLLELNPNEKEDFRVTIGLSEETGDEYQNETFSMSLHVAAKQVYLGSEWPATY
jgi:predicted ribosomally synthesized peptide with SipW-like signal peptide